VSPDKKLLAVVGDDRDALLVDSRNGKVCFFCLFYQAFWFINLAFCGLIHNLLLLLLFFYYISILRAFIKKYIVLPPFTNI
jgi:hypothetical protein